MSETRIVVRIERPIVLEIEIPSERLESLQGAIDLLNKGTCEDESPAGLTGADIAKILGLPGEEHLDAPHFSVRRGYMAPFSLHDVPEE